jgi:hypothetical protein
MQEAQGSHQQPQQGGLHAGPSQPVRQHCIEWARQWRARSHSCRYAKGGAYVSSGQHHHVHHHVLKYVSYQVGSHYYSPPASVVMQACS